MEKELIPKILFEDTHLLVLSKPAGLLSQGEITGDSNLVDWLREYLGRPYVGLVHRLDRNTSGLMVVAKRTKSAQRLTQALQDGKICRAYLGLVEGALTTPARWAHWLLKDEGKNTVRVVATKREGAKEAVMTATPIEKITRFGKAVTLVKFVLETGRSHQIRVQAAHEGHPLIGDRKYGAKIDYPRPALHSAYLEFPHPMSGEIMKFEELADF